MLLSVLCEQKCVTIIVVVTHLKVTLFQFLAILYLVTYDAFKVSLVESLLYDEMQKTKDISFAFNKTKSQKQCFIWDDIRERHAFSTIFLHRVGSSWVTPDDLSKQWFSALSKFGWSGPTPDDLDPDRSDRSGGLVWPRAVQWCCGHEENAF